MTDPCKIEGCEKPRARRNGLCAMHNARVERHGSTDRITYHKSCQQCGKGGLIKIGLCDACYRHFKRHGDFTRRRRARGEGHINSKGYKVITENGKREYEHRKVVAAPPGTVVHHKDKKTLNNDPNNLEIMTRSDHMALHHKERKND